MNQTQTGLPVNPTGLSLASRGTGQKPHWVTNCHKDRVAEVLACEEIHLVALFVAEPAETVIGTVKQLKALGYVGIYCPAIQFLADQQAKLNGAQGGQS